MKNKKEHFFRKQNGKTNMPSYIIELKSIFDTEQGKYEILNLEQTDLIIKNSYENLRDAPQKKYIFDFSKKDIFLEKLFAQCSKSSPGKFYLFIENSRDCGIAVMDSILMVKSNFQFSSEHAGLMSIFSGDLLNKILLDYYYEDDKQLIEIELSGFKWSTIII